MWYVTYRIWPIFEGQVRVWTIESEINLFILYEWDNPSKIKSARKLNLNISFFIFEKSENPILKSLLEQMSSLKQQVSSIERCVITG